MATVKLLVSGLAKYVNDVNAALPHMAQAFAPFGITLSFGSGRLLDRDPGTISSGWDALIEELTAMTAAAGADRPGHIVFTELASSRDPTINGELKLSTRGVCAVYLAAGSFQVEPAERARRIVEVSVHELGHLFNMTHSDGFRYATHCCSMMSFSDRRAQTLAQAWTLAVQDAAQRGERAVAIPNPMTYYPFAVQCRTILREAAFNRDWWPWANAFRGMFEEPGEAGDKSALVDISPHGEIAGALVGDGIALTLAFRASGSADVTLPLHIGPEFGNLRVTISRPDGDTVLFQPEGIRCADATTVLSPGKTMLRSFSLIPRPEQPLFPVAGGYVCQFALLFTAHGRPVTLGTAHVHVAVNEDTRGMAGRQRSVQVVSDARGQGARPSRQLDLAVTKAAAHSVAGNHALYKIACGARTRKRRLGLLERSMDVAAPTAIRHRAARAWVREMVDSGSTFDELRGMLAGRFASADDEELHETLDRMEEGWKSLQQ